MDFLRRQFFRGNPVANDVLGTEETVGALTRDVIAEYWRSRYSANNIVISVAGNFEWDSILPLLQDLTAGWPNHGGRSEPGVPEPHSGTFVFHKESSQENLGFAFSGVPVADADYYTAALVAQALGGSSHSRLFQEVREKRGLAYAVQARFDGMEHAGLMRVYVGTSADRAHESVEVVLQELQKLQSGGITDDELRLSKTRLKSQLVMRSESTLARMASNMRSWWFEEKLYTLADVAQRIDAVDLPIVADLLKRLDITERMTAVALGPRSEEELFGGVMARS
jgi:predicted Zn-dependent peptidase